MIERYRRALERIGLPAWFIAIDLLWIAKPETFAIDARHYQRAASAWLAGGNPFAVTESGVPYVAGPHTLLFYAPSSLLPLSVAVAFWMTIGLAAAVWTVRKLDVPIWWIAFPPLAHALWNGNPQSVVVALLVAGGTGPAVVAAGLKLYVGLTLAFRPKQLIVTGLVLLVLLLVVPWQAYLAASGEVSDHLATAWNGSAWRIPVLVAPTLLALWIRRRSDAQWFAVPAMWPGTQFYYVSTVLPAVVRKPFAAAALALPVPLMAPLVVMALAVLEVRRSRSDARPALEPQTT